MLPALEKVPVAQGRANAAGDRAAQRAGETVSAAPRTSEPAAKVAIKKLSFDLNPKTKFLNVKRWEVYDAGI